MSIVTTVDCIVTTVCLGEIITASLVTPIYLRLLCLSLSLRLISLFVTTDVLMTLARS